MLGNRVPLSSWLSIAILSSISAMGVYAETMITPAIPDIIKNYRLEYDDSSWIIGSFIISGAIMTPVSGQLSDVYGKKNILIIMVIIYAIGALTGGFGRDFYSLICSRVLQGIGLSIVPIGLSIMSDLFPKDKIAIGQGIFSTITASGGVVGLLLGGFVIQGFGWKSIFFLVAPITAIIIVLIWIIIPSDHYVSNYNNNRRSTKINVRSVLNRASTTVIKRTSHYKKQQYKAMSQKTTLENTKPRKWASNIDVRGIITLSISTICFLVVMTNFKGGSSFSFSISGLQASLLAIALTSLLVFIMVEKRKTTTSISLSNSTGSFSPSHYLSRRPIVDFNLLRNNNTILLCIFLLVIAGFLMYTIFHTIPILARSPSPVGFGKNAIVTSDILLSIPIASLLAGPVVGFIIYKLGSARSVIISSIVIAIGYVTIMIFYSNEFYMPVHLFVISTGYLFINTAALNLIIRSVPKNMMGTSLGLAVFLKYIGAAVGPVISGMYMWTHLSTTSNNNNNEVIPRFIPSFESYQTIFLYCTIMAIASIALALVLSRVSPRCQHHSLEERGDMGQVASSIIDEIMQWQGVTKRPHSYGGFQFKIHGVDIGHVHGDSLVDLPMPPRLHQQISSLKKQNNNKGNRSPNYHIYRETGWIAYYLNNDVQDLSTLIQDFKLQYERIRFRSKKKFNTYI